MVARMTDRIKLLILKFSVFVEICRKRFISFFFFINAFTLFRLWIVEDSGVVFFLNSETFVIFASYFPFESFIKNLQLF